MSSNPSLACCGPSEPLAEMRYDPETRSYVLTARDQQFLARLSALSRELGVYIVGCGCCRSPYVVGEREYAEISAEYRRSDAVAKGDLWFDADRGEYVLGS